MVETVNRRLLAIGFVCGVSLQTVAVGQVAMVSLSEHFDTVGGLTRLPDQTILVVGWRMLPSQGEVRQSEARVLAIAPDDGSTATTLASLPGGAITRDRALNVSSNGEFIVGHSVSENSINEAALWRRAEPGIPIPMGFLPSTLPGLGQFSESYSVSDDGTAVGSTFPSRPFLWSLAAGEAQQLPHNTFMIGGFNATRAAVRDISADGSVIVGASQDESLGLEATTFSVDTFAFLSDTTQTDSRALAVSPNGKYIVGFSNSPDSIVGPDSPTVWKEGTVQLLEDAAGPIVGKATSVADNGFVVGFIANGPGDDDDTPFIWREDFENGHAREFAEWLSTDYGATLPGTPREISDVYWNPPLLDLAVTLEGAGPQVVSVSLTQMTVGDFDKDGNVDIHDLDSLCDQIAVASGDLGFDLNGDNNVGQDDARDFLTLVGSLAGDINLDGDVEFADFLILADHFGEAGSWSHGDLDCDGTVQFPDFLILAENFGNSAGDMESVPEPASVTCALAALVGCVFVRRRRPRSST